MMPHLLRINLAGWAHLFVFGLLLPALVVRNARAIALRQMPLPQRLTHFRSTAVMLAVIAGTSLLVANVERMPLFDAGVPHLLRGMSAGLAMYLAAVLVMRPFWRKAVARGARVVHLFVADTLEERAWWFTVSVLAGIGEEITWRGVQTGLLAPLVGDYWIAAALSGISFALAHGVQGWQAVCCIFLFALCFQLVVVASGSLLIGMLVHIAYDLTAGFTYGRLAREMGYVADLGLGQSAIPATVSDG
jgi:membrane protease YdiL (CAAX protease family)